MMKKVIYYIILNQTKIIKLDYENKLTHYYPQKFYIIVIFKIYFLFFMFLLLYFMIILYLITSRI